MLAPSVQTLSFLFLLALGFVLGFAVPGTYDPDIWWHLKTGEWILANGAVPWEDPFSYNTEGMRWIAYSWLAEIFFHFADQLDPLLGLRFIQGAVAAATVGVLYFHARTASKSPRLALLLCALFVIPTFPWLVRPQIFSFLLTASVMFLLWWGEHRDRRAWWGLPPLMVLWANLHIYFLFGLGLIWLLLVWPWLVWFIQGRMTAEPPDLAGIFAALLATAAPLLNPYGLTLYDEAFRLALHGAAEWPADVIKELASPNFHDWPRKVFFVWIALGLVAFIVPGKKPPVLIVLLFLALLYRSLQHVRDTPYLLVVMLPIYAQRFIEIANSSWQRFLSGGQASWLRISWPGASLHWLLVLCAAASFAVLPLKLGEQKQELAKHRTDGYPAAATRYLLEKRPEGPIYNSLNWGGYLIYTLTPAYRVYIDGRTQLYTSKFWEVHDAVRHGKADWEKSLKESGARIVLWHRDEALASLLRNLPEWELVHEDSESVVFLKRDPE